MKNTYVWVWSSQCEKSEDCMQWFLCIEYVSTEGTRQGGTTLSRRWSNDKSLSNSTVLNAANCSLLGIVLCGLSDCVTQTENYFLLTILLLRQKRCFSEMKTLQYEIKFTEFGCCILKHISHEIWLDIYIKNCMITT